MTSVRNSLLTEAPIPACPVPPTEVPPCNRGEHPPPRFALHRLIAVLVQKRDLGGADGIAVEDSSSQEVGTRK